MSTLRQRLKRLAWRTRQWASERLYVASRWIEEVSWRVLP